MAGDTLHGSGGSPPLSAERFRAIVDAYGADPARWPPAERAAAQAYAATAPDAEELLRDARAVDALLNTVAAPEPSADLIARILAETPKPATASPPKSAGAGSRLWDWLQAGPSFGPIGMGPVLAASIAVGVVTGFALPSEWRGGVSPAETIYSDAADEFVLAAFGYQSEEETSNE